MSTQGQATTTGTATAALGHFYCEDDPRWTTPMCGAVKPPAEGGTDCPLCELVTEKPIVCAFCGEPHVVE